MQSSATKEPLRAANSKEKASLTSYLIKVFSALHLFKTPFHRHLPKTGSTCQWEETGQVPECWPWGPLPLWPWLWAGGCREQGLSGEPDLEWPSDVLPRWMSIISVFRKGHFVSVNELCVWLGSTGVKLDCICSALCSSSSNTTWSTLAIQPSSFQPDIKECASSPCLNGGTCVDEVNQFSCVCGKGWSGPTCQTPLPTCKHAAHSQSHSGGFNIWIKMTSEALKFNKEDLLRSGSQ